MTEKLEHAQVNLKEAEATQNAPFELAEELEAKVNRLNEVNHELALDKPDNDVFINEEDEKETLPAEKREDIDDDLSYGNGRGDKKIR